MYFGISLVKYFIIKKYSEQLNGKDVGFVNVKGIIDTTTVSKKSMPTVFGAMAELERDCILGKQLVKSRTIIKKSIDKGSAVRYNDLSQLL